MKISCIMFWKEDCEQLKTYLIVTTSPNYGLVKSVTIIILMLKRIAANVKKTNTDKIKTSINK
jgi:hypothetical protein